MLLGLCPPTPGTPACSASPLRRPSGTAWWARCPRRAACIQRVTVRELLAFVGGTYATPMPLDRLVELAQIGGLEGRRVDKLSGGQAQRVRFAMALAGDPGLVVLDEPTAALDVTARREFWKGMRALADRGTTVLFSTHYLDEADEHADRVVVIDRGHLVADGTSAEIKRVVALTTVSVTADGEVARFGELPGVRRVEVRGDRVHLRTSDPDATVMALARAGAVRDLEVTPADLEEAFVALTAKETV